MNEKLKFPLKLQNGTIITTVKELEIFFRKREQDINKASFNNGINSKLNSLTSSSNLGSGLNGYGLELINGEE